MAETLLLANSRWKLAPNSLLKNLGKATLEAAAIGETHELAGDNGDDSDADEASLGAPDEADENDPSEEESSSSDVDVIVEIVEKEAGIAATFAAVKGCLDAGATTSATTTDEAVSITEDGAAADKADSLMSKKPG